MILYRFLTAAVTLLVLGLSDGGRCPSSPYRRPDGSCNNVRHPDYGAVDQPYLRISHRRRNGSVWEGSGGVIAALEKTFNPSHHAHLTALLGIWADLLYKDISQPKIDKDGKLVNGATGFLDGSDLYGTEYHNPLRDNRGGIDIKACIRCSSGSGLGSLYTILYQEHNRIVDGLSTLNPYWPADVLYEEAKRIVVAQLQHITFNEFLPVVLGEASWSKIPQEEGFYHGYSSSIRAGTVYETAMSVLHFLPTMIPPPLMSMGIKNNGSETSAESMMTDMMMTSLTTPAQVPNMHFNTFDGYVAAARLLDHSRDEGMASYVDVATLCGNASSTNFSDLVFVSPENHRLLASVYRKAEEIDLLIGGVLEKLRQGSIVGPSFNCLLTNQFLLLRDSDRFWYENDLPPSSFTKAQLTEIRKVTLSGLLCENINSLTSIQPKAFFQEDPFLNAAIFCDHHSMFELEPWRGTAEKDEMMLDGEQVKRAIKKAEQDLARRQRKEFVTYSNVGGVDPKSPVGTAAAFSKPNKMALLMANNSLLYEYATQELMDTFKAKQARRRRQLDGDNVIGFVPDISVKDFLSDLDIGGFFPPARHVEPECHEETGPCDPGSPYRTYTGHCNNLDRPNLGRSLTTFARLLPSVYDNGISSPRLNGVNGLKLPSARLVSSMIHVDISHLHSRYSLMMMQFAQFVDHDITFTPNHRGFFASIPDCRSCDSALTVHPECMPIHIPTGDPFYPQLNISTGERMCLPFMRSLPGQQKLGSREQINQNSAYLDGSHIYGENACLGRELRGYGGRLNVTVHPTRGKDLMPISSNHPECKAPSGYCFIAGDARASEQPGLTAIHSVYMREHNRLADNLRLVNPHWGDERVYQTARKILVASYQHVLYNEFLPRLLGWNAINLYGLKLHHHGYYKGIQHRYSGSCNPNIVTEFATAAYRIGHSLLRPHIPRMSPAYTPVEPPILLRDAFFNPDIIYQPHIIDEIMRGLVSTPMENLDQFITGEISNHLFEDRRIPHSGMDLPALNIQRGEAKSTYNHKEVYCDYPQSLKLEMASKRRNMFNENKKQETTEIGRDHGIPPYNEYRTLCNLKRATTWEDLSREIPLEVIARLRLIYDTVNDVDLFPGGLSERPLQGGLVGPTFACIIGLQFRQLRKCDRFWYESGDPLVRFTEPQLAEIRKTTLSKIICDNLDVQSEMQKSAFDQASEFLNPRVPCHSLPTIDLNLWREGIKPGCQIGGRSVPVGDSALPTPCTSCICTEEGAQCASLRVTDCGRLVREAGRDAVLRDEVCSAQCPALLLTEGPPPLHVIEEVVSLTTRRPRHRVRTFDSAALLPPPPPLSHRRPPPRKFALPDIATFLG